MRWFPRLAVALVAGVGVLLAACGSDAPTISAPDLVEYEGIPIDRTTVGAPDAPVHVVHWGDFQ